MARAMSTSIFTGSASSTGRRAVTGPKLDLLGRVQLMLKVWKERHDLAHLDATALRDLGLTKSDVANEVSRSPLDVPQNRY
jgi:uncharacterized protein YjiS (DUF1127 family)